jgi:hypothetical protein
LRSPPLTRLWYEAPLESEFIYVMNNQTLEEQHEYQSVPAGQERLATQAERDDVNEKIESLHPTSDALSDQK